MEGIQTINALKAVASSLPAQTTIPSGELVMLYAADGTPIAMIARDDLVKAVASVMASNSQTTFSKLLGVQANGTPMGIGASDLASVLGAALLQQTPYSIDANDLVTEPRMLIFTTTISHSQNLPSDAVYGWLIVEKMGNVIIQYDRGLDNLAYKKIRRSEDYGATWGGWTSD